MKTEPIVLKIFGNERCVVSLDDLEAAARAIHQRTFRDCTARERISSNRGAEAAKSPERQSETSANPSTLGAEIESQIRMINAKSGPSETEAPRTFDEITAWLGTLRERSECLDDSTPAKTWNLMLRSFALQAALRSDHAHPDFRKAAMANPRRLTHELQRIETGRRTHRRCSHIPRDQSKAVVSICFRQSGDCGMPSKN
ncbi:MAG: hypothetical protein ABIP85_00355 [Chthoniobacteraceae bacterium]